MKKILSTIGLVALLATGIKIGSGLAGEINKAKTNTENQGIELEDKRNVYAILANTSGPEQIERFSEENSNYSMLNILSFYKFLKSNGVDDANITLLTYNPQSKDIFKTKEYKSLLERKAYSGILPSEKDKIEIDGKATKKNLMEAIERIHPNPNDIIYLVISNPSPKKTQGFSYGVGNLHVELDKETLYSFEMGEQTKKLKQGKTIFILNNGEADSFFKQFDKRTRSQIATKYAQEKEINSKEVLGIMPGEESDFDKEIFIMNLINGYSNGKQSIKETIRSAKGKAYYFDGGNEKSPEECPWINHRLIN